LSREYEVRIAEVALNLGIALLAFHEVRADAAPSLHGGLNSQEREDD
jgi:hypothetical protein